MAFGMGSSFQEPQSPDQTSAPPETVPGQVSPVSQGIAALLAKAKKKQRSPAALKAAIASAKRARQSGRKMG